MMTRLAATVLALFGVTALLCEPAYAQVITSEGGEPIDPNQGQQDQVPVQQQPVQQQPFMEGAQPEPQPIMEGGQEVQQVEQQPERLVRQISGYLSVPFFLTDGNIGTNVTTGMPVDVGPGFGIHGRFGWELGFIVLEGSVGWQLQGLSNTNSTFQDIWIGLGARFQLLNRSRMVPFISAAFRLNIWSERVSTAGTSTVSAYEVDPGAQVALGLTIEISQSFGIEAAVSSNFLFGVSDFFQDFQFFLQPWIGATLFI